jgi:uncharacterized protein
MESCPRVTDGRCRLRQPHLRRGRYAPGAISLEELETWIDQLDPPPLIDGVSMLDSYRAATIVGPCFVDPHEWLHHMLHSGLGMDGSEQVAAIMAIVTRFSEGLAKAPEQYAPIFGRIDDGTVLATPWCMGFLAAMQLRSAAWQPLRDPSRIEHRLLLPILLHCTEAARHPLLGRVRPGLKVTRFLRTAYHDIPLAVPAIREFWMPQRATSWST